MVVPMSAFWCFVGSRVSDVLLTSPESAKDVAAEFLPGPIPLAAGAVLVLFVVFRVARNVSRRMKEMTDEEEEEEE
jgi:hypothetical protein